MGDAGELGFIMSPAIVDEGEPGFIMSPAPGDENDVVEPGFNMSPALRGLRGGDSKCCEP